MFKITLQKSYIYLILFIILGAFFTGFALAETPRRSAVLGINIASGQETGGPVEGVTIAGVTPGGGADDAGLQVEDVIFEINGVSLMATSDRIANQSLLDFMADVSPGDNLQVSYLRDGQANQLTLTAGELDPTLIVEPGFPFMRDLERLSRQLGREFVAPLQYRWRHQGLFAGMELVAITPQLGRYFGTEYGLLVVRAPTDQTFDLQDGDVIRAIGGRTPQDPAHAMRILRSYEPGETVVIGIMREQRDLDIAVVLTEQSQTHGFRKQPAP